MRDAYKAMRIYNDRRCVAIWNFIYYFRLKPCAKPSNARSYWLQRDLIGLAKLHCHRLI
jgi:hypothetical protein